MTYDLLIKNARVVDGSGEPSFRADVAVHQGKIVGVGKYNAAARRTIDADGRVVAPGFIDHHTHFDPQALWILIAVLPFRMVTRRSWSVSAGRSSLRRAPATTTGTSSSSPRLKPSR